MLRFLLANMSWLYLPKPILALAHVADLTDGPFCRVCKFDHTEKLIVLQLFGSSPEIIVEATKIFISQIGEI